ncbi:hypothetical protein EGV02_05860 [Stutzerimonas stutzeri]|nr:hypothetical protein EGV02_05860 [Stutzerimonas stutzeri]
MNRRFQGPVAVATGATQGIGRRVARGLLGLPPLRRLPRPTLLTSFCQFSPTALSRPSRSQPPAD